MKKIKSVLIVSILILPALSINTGSGGIIEFFDNLFLSEEEKLGQLTLWDRIQTGQLWIDWLYGKGKVSVKIWDSSLKVSSLTGSKQQVNIKIPTDKLSKLQTDFPDATIEVLYNSSSYTYVMVEDDMDNIAQSFWDNIFSSKVTLADKSYVKKMSLNQEMSLITPMASSDYADKDDICRTTYDLCYDYGILATNYSGKNISIAVLDTGVKNSHLGFTNITAGTNTTIYNESFVPGEDWVDHNGHGTHCIGIIAGQNTSVGGVEMRGVAPNATIYSLKVLDSKGRGNEDDIIEGIMRAVELDVDIISMSLGGSIDYFSAFRDAIQYAVGKGVIVVAAAGNSAQIVSSQPASWEGVISVEALAEDKHIAPYTCLGGDISAEGTNITSLDYKDSNSTATYSGTSMATPFVAGCIALLLEAQPSFRGKPGKVESYLKTTGDLAPSSAGTVKWLRYIPFTPNNYCYDTREVSPDTLVDLEAVTTSRETITDIRVQLLRDEGV